MAQSILIVEDEPMVVMEWKEVLESAGFKVLEAVNSADLLLSSVREQNPDLVLMDVRLHSFLDGIDAVSRLRFLSPLPVIYISGASNPETIRRAQATLPSAFLVKPVDSDQLVETVRRALTSPPKG